MEFREYKSFKKKRTGRRRFPVIRIILLVGCASFLYARGYVDMLVQKIEQLSSSRQSPSSVSSGDKSLRWDRWCAVHGGTAFTLKNGMGQCSWRLHGKSDTLLNYPLLRYYAENESSHFPKDVHWLAPVSDFRNPVFLGVQNGTQVRWIYRMRGADSSLVWVNARGCRFPGVCPGDPLPGGALPIPDDFDFEGRESLLMKDQFLGLQNSQVYSVLPGRVVSVGKDAAGYVVELDHGGNLLTRSSGHAGIAQGIVPGASVKGFSPLGRLAAADSASLYFEVIRNGKFVRWNDFYAETHVVKDSAAVRAFRGRFGV